MTFSMSVAQYSDSADIIDLFPLVVLCYDDLV